jgi:hypothetical protein
MGELLQGQRAVGQEVATVDQERCWHSEQKKQELHACCEHRQSLLHFHSPSDRRCLAAKTEADGERLDRGNKRLVDEVWHLWTRPPKRGDVDHCAASWSAKAVERKRISQFQCAHPSPTPQQAPQQRKFHQRGFEENATVCACVARAEALWQRE